MSIARTIFVTSAAILTISLCSALNVAAQQSTSKSTEQVRMVRYSGDLAYFLAQIPVHMGVTIGFEIDPKQPQTQITIAVDDATFSDIMNAVVQARPGYEWQRNGDNVDVFLTGKPNPLLDIPVNNFQVSNVVASAAIDQLMGLPEVQASLLSMNFQYRQSTNKQTPHTTPVKFSLNLQGVTVRQALHAIARASESQFWILRKYAGNPSFFSINTSPAMP